MLGRKPVVEMPFESGQPQGMGEVRTSQNSPLRIDAVRAGDAGGVIGMTLCPGKCGPSHAGAPWKRDLETDLRAIRQWHALAIVTCMEEPELRTLGVANLGAATVAASLWWFTLPISDTDIPDLRFETAWRNLGQSICATLSNGGRLVVHCRRGLGRTGLVASLMLIELGMRPDMAIQTVRKARPGAIETPAQESYVRHYQPLFSLKRSDDMRTAASRRDP
jgi:ADP-ribosyl-[dinitrogen reductase] hydrolase